MDGRLGPYEVAPEQIVRLGPSFTRFVNQLLAVEMSAAGQLGATLDTNYMETVADGGVDAATWRSGGTAWVPEGNAAWQFKRSDQSPKKAASELHGATWAHELLKDGASYRLVIGAALTARKIRGRRDALIAEATALGLPKGEGLYDVIDANALARWTSEHANLAVSQLLGGTGMVGRDFDAWALSRDHHGFEWVAAPSRTEAVVQLRRALADSSISDMRVVAVAGMGKTRTVMEALRGETIAPLVVYIDDAEQLAGAHLNHLVQQDRTAVIIADGCSARRHGLLAAAIPAGSAIKLISIGEPDAFMHRGTPVIALPALETDAIEAVLTQNVPTLWPEARRVAASHAAGNITFAIWLGEQIVRDPSASPAELITSDRLAQYAATAIPGDADFLACTILALFSRIGWDGEVAAEARLVASVFGLEFSTLKATVRSLERAHLLVRQGRYRYVSPHPVAVYLAAEGWRDLGPQIVTDLLPQLGENQAAALFRRAAELGHYGPTRDALELLLGEDGPFATFDKLSEANNAARLVEMAIVAPDEVAAHLANMLATASREELAELRSIRRPLVSTLEKLAWHSRLFDHAADDLLQLALSENETWSNNATGTWVELFGTMLPGTAAGPLQRLDYLRRKAASEDVSVRLLVARACKQALSSHEWIMVSGELQGGVVVEPRGTPATYGDTWNYQREIILLLRELADDPSTDVSAAAAADLVAAIHPFLVAVQVRETLFDALASLKGPALQSARTEVENLDALFHRVNDVEDRQEGLSALRDRLPPSDSFETLTTLLHARRWDLAEGELKSRIAASVNELAAQDLERILDLLALPVEAAFEFGYGLASIEAESDRILGRLVMSLDTNFAALTGFLWGVHDAGQQDVFDVFIDGPVGSALPADARVALTVRGIASPIGLDRVRDLLKELPVREGALSLFGWHRELRRDRVAELLADWLGRLSSQDDYNAVVDFVNMCLYDVQTLPAVLDAEVAALVFRRADFPEVAQEGWDWARMAEKLLDSRRVDVISLLLDLMDSEESFSYSGSEDSALLRQCVEADPSAAWTEIADRIEAGSWRLQIRLRGSLVDLVPVESIASWIGGDLERARIVASVASVGRGTPTPIARLLLAEFGGDEQVASSLVGDFVTGSWMGSESGHLTGQIDLLTGWLSDSNLEPAVHAWARSLSEGLKRQRTSALRREAEEGY